MVWPAGESAFVTGAASGIGLGVARALLAAGANVAVADIDGARVDDVVQQLAAADGAGTVTGVVLDVSDPKQWQAAADQAESAIGPVSILCNNAGVTAGSRIADTSWELWRWVQSVNIDSQFLGVSTFLPRIESRGGRGHILNTASMAGLVPIVTQGAYAASKFASVGLSIVLRDELQGTGIGVSVLCPGSVATRLGRTAAEGAAKITGETVSEDVMQLHESLLAGGADPDEVGKQVVEAMQDGQFLIITHKEWTPLVERVQGEILDTFHDFDGRHGVDVNAQMLASGANIDGTVKS
ncbi:SDR family NAD(P)-dependent oxidoreductase [Mycobacterium sp. C31M]